MSTQTIRSCIRLIEQSVDLISDTDHVSVSEGVGLLFDARDQLEYLLDECYQEEDYYDSEDSLY